MFTFYLLKIFCRESLKNKNFALKKFARNFSTHAFRHWKKGLSAGAGLGLSLKCFQWMPTVEAENSSKLNLRQRFNFVADVVEDVASAVVYIEVKSMRFFNIMPPNGSGFIVRKDGLILTNAHVVMNRTNSVVQIKLQDGRTFSGIVEDIDLKSDLATIRINAQNLPVMKLGSSSDVRPGEWVVAIGSPLSLSNSITCGVISSTRRQSSEIGITNKEMEYLQTDASITFGNSGGPLVNLDGEAIGINCMKIAGGISFAIPIDYAKSFLKRSEQRIVRHNSQIVKLKYAGVTVFSLTPGMLDEMRFGEYHMPEEITSGLLIGKVVSGSPAHISGLKTGDVVTHINSKVVQDVNSIYKALESGKPLNMRIIRNGIFQEIIIIPEDI